MNGLTRLFKQLFSSPAKSAVSDTPPSQSLSIDQIKEYAPTWLVVGLGNPGAQYAATRHNVGYLTVDTLLPGGGDQLVSIKGYKAVGTCLEISQEKVLVLRSTTFMNLSGQAVGPVAKALQIPAQRIIVIHDELDLPEHTVRLKLGGNENGHNGLKSISQELETRDYLRVRVGIGRPAKTTPIPEYVLGPVNSGTELDSALERAASGVQALLSEGLNKAQNQIHSR